MSGSPTPSSMSTFGKWAFKSIPAGQYPINHFSGWLLPGFYNSIHVLCVRDPVPTAHPSLGSLLCSFEFSYCFLYTLALCQTSVLISCKQTGLHEQRKAACLGGGQQRCEL